MKSKFIVYNSLLEEQSARKMRKSKIIYPDHVERALIFVEPYYDSMAPTRMAVRVIEKGGIYIYRFKEFAIKRKARDKFLEAQEEDLIYMLNSYAINVPIYVKNFQKMRAPIRIPIRDEFGDVFIYTYKKNMEELKKVAEFLQYNPSISGLDFIVLDPPRGSKYIILAKEHSNVGDFLLAVHMLNKNTFELEDYLYATTEHIEYGLMEHILLVMLFKYGFIQDDKSAIKHLSNNLESLSI